MLQSPKTYIAIFQRTHQIQPWVSSYDTLEALNTALQRLLESGDLVCKPVVYSVCQAPTALGFVISYLETRDVSKVVKWEVIDG